MFPSFFQGRRGVYLSALGAGMALAGLMAAADPAADPVFKKVRTAVQANVAETRGMACMASVERTRYLPRVAGKPASCAEVLASMNGGRRAAVAWHDRERLDVTAGAAGETFAFTGVTPFERTDIAGLLHAASAQSGEFSDFLRKVISTEGVAFQPISLQQTPLGKLLAMGFTIPGGAGPAAYSGSLFLLPESGDPRRLVFQADNVGSACRAQYTIDYAATRVGDRQYVLPQSSIMESVDADGAELHTETYYSSCRRTGATPAVAAAAPPAVTRPLPAGTRFRVRFQPPIDGETAAIGDPVVGVIRTTVKDKQTGVIVHAGDRIHGRIALIEQFQQPERRWNVAVAFETIERGVGDHGIDQGVEQSVTLAPLDDGDRAQLSVTPEQLKTLRPAGGAYFVFHDNNIVLDQRFETDWEVR